MPELPEVQTVVDGLQSEIVGKKIEKVEIFWPGYIVTPAKLEFADALIGQQVKRAERRGKFIVIHLTNFSLLLHLRMTGSVQRFGKPAEFPKHTHVAMLLDDSMHLIFNDIRKFGRLELVPSDMLDERFAKMKLGVEPLSEALSSDYLRTVLHKSKRPIKNILLDQRVIVGIGNIYASEICFESALNPEKTGSDLNNAEIEKIKVCTKEVLNKALELGGSSISDYVRLNGEQGEMQKHFQVYGRMGQTCNRCQSEIQKIRQAGRSTFFCPNCQK